MKLQSHKKIEYGLTYKGRVYGGIANPHLFTLKQATKLVKTDHFSEYTVVKIRITREVIAEVFV